VRTQRRRIERLLQDNPSLKSFIPVIVRDELSWIAEETALALQDAGELAEDAYRPMTAAFYTEDELLGDWLPEPPAA
jgi:isopentenyl diphosphate isomerase/L-lactate dehydrogenase-like FMN-dependent dehydrogenase